MRFAAPETVEEAVKLLGAEPGMAKVLAGGSDLIVQMKSGRLEPTHSTPTREDPAQVGAGAITAEAKPRHADSSTNRCSSGVAKRSSLERTGSLS